FLFVRLFTCSAPVFTYLPRVSAGKHTTTQNTHCSGFGCLFFSACWWPPPPSVGMERGEERGSSHRESLSCRRDAPPMTALSRAPNPIVGGMAGNFIAASRMDKESLLRLALWVIACSVCVLYWLRALAISCWPWD
ncbi:trans-sialidase, partial [Trypanosoma cruzi]